VSLCLCGYFFLFLGLIFHNDSILMRFFWILEEEREILNTEQAEQPERERWWLKIIKVRMLFDLLSSILSSLLNPSLVAPPCSVFN